MKIMLGGSRNVTALPTEIIEAVNKHLEQEVEFIVGDCYGADVLLQEALRDYPRVQIFGAGKYPRNRANGSWLYVQCVSEGNFKQQQTYKDQIMCNRCDLAFLVVKGSSPGTKRNMKDLESQGKYYRIF